MLARGFALFPRGQANKRRRGSLAKLSHSTAFFFCYCSALPLWLPGLCQSETKIKGKLLVDPGGLTRRGVPAGCLLVELFSYIYRSCPLTGKFLKQSKSNPIRNPTPHLEKTHSLSFSSKKQHPSHKPSAGPSGLVVSPGQRGQWSHCPVLVAGACGTSQAILVDCLLNSPNTWLNFYSQN